MVVDVYNFEEWWTQCIQQKRQLEDQNIRYIMSWEDGTTKGENDVMCWHNRGEKASRSRRSIFSVVVASRLVWIARFPRETYEEFISTQPPFTVIQQFLLKIVYKYFRKLQKASDCLSKNTLEDANIELQLAGGQFIRSALLSPDIIQQPQQPQEPPSRRPLYRPLLKAMDDEMNERTRRQIEGSTGKEEDETGLRAYWTGANNGGRFLVVRYHSWQLHLVEGQGQVVRVMYKSYDGVLTLVVHCEIGKDASRCRDPPQDVLKPGAW